MGNAAEPTPVVGGNARMREASGKVDSSDATVVFLYLLLRDHLPASALETALDYATQAAVKGAEFTNGWLAEYAKDMAKRLRDFRA